MSCRRGALLRCWTRLDSKLFVQSIRCCGCSLVAFCCVCASWTACQCSGCLPASAQAACLPVTLNRTCCNALLLAPSLRLGLLPARYHITFTTSSLSVSSDLTCVVQACVADEMDDGSWLDVDDEPELHCTEDLPADEMDDGSWLDDEVWRCLCYADCCACCLCCIYVQFWFSASLWWGQCIVLI